MKAFYKYIYIKNSIPHTFSYILKISRVNQYYPCVFIPTCKIEEFIIRKSVPYLNQISKSLKDILNWIQFILIFSSIGSRFSDKQGFCFMIVNISYFINSHVNMRIYIINGSVWALYLSALKYLAVLTLIQHCFNYNCLY